MPEAARQRRFCWTDVTLRHSELKKCRSNRLQAVRDRRYRELGAGSCDAARLMLAKNAAFRYLPPHRVETCSALGEVCE
jgi:hypothetical protein